MKHINVALFVPDEGCPHRCSFCNQKTISGSVKKLTVDDVHSAVEIALNSNFDSSNGEIAFFGGSFTAIEKSYMISLLEAASLYVRSGKFKGIRISTRPDCIDREILTILAEYGVNAIELGCQSMSDKVLALNGRGHDSQCIVDAAKLIRQFDFELGVQMMTGLYGDDDKTAFETASKLIALAPDTVRIYPTIVLEDTLLARLYKQGRYMPQTLDEAVTLCSKLLIMFNDAGVKVIRLGLHSGGGVEKGYLAGAYHPAFRELCESRIYLDKALEKIRLDNIRPSEIDVTVGSKYVSQFIGQSGTNRKTLEKLGYKIKIKQDNTFKQYQINIQGSTR
ncbi:MAG: radical SAM protein [Ruminococcus sp.]|nr:radical SAM protein [Ruminococcus sp.]